MNEHELTDCRQVDIESPMRADKYIAEHWAILTRSQIKQRQARIEVNGRESKLSKKVSFGDELAIFYQPLEEFNLTPEKIDLDVIFENKDVLVINKPQGLVVHPAAGNFSGTLVHGLLYRYKEEEFAGTFQEESRPGIVHRLDKDTSGVIITAKSVESLNFLAQQFREKTTRKRYVALVKGCYQYQEGRIENYLIRDPHNRKKYTWRDQSGQGKHSITDYKVLKTFDDYSFVSLHPKTGRTHQLRVHSLSLGHPILGDPIYSRRGPNDPDNLMLHAYSLKIMLPGETQVRHFQAPIPERFRPFIGDGEVE